MTSTSNKQQVLSFKFRFHIVYFLFFFSLNSFGQNIFTVKGLLKDKNNKPVAAAAIKLLNDKNADIIKFYAVSDDKGFFKINNITQGEYELQVIVLGYKTFKKFVSVTKNTNLNTIALQEDTLVLNEVVINAKKKIVKLTDAGIKLNVQGTPLARKKDVLAILKYAPNINGLEIAGSNAIKLLLNGKEIKIKPSQFATFLKSIKPNSIKNIEITDRVDASFEGNITGQINIITKKDDGFTGSIGSSIGYNNRFLATTDASFFYSKNKFRFYTELYKSDHQVFFKERGVQIIDNDLTYNIKRNRKLKRQEAAVILGFDYDIDSLSTLSFLYDYVSDNDKDFNITSNQQISSSKVKDSLLNIVKDFDHIDKTHTFSLQYQKKLDSLGSNLKFSTDYAINNYKNPFVVKSQFFSRSVLVDSTETFQPDITNSNILGIKLDWKKKWANGNSFATGSKYSFNSNTDDFNYFDKIDNRFVSNQTFTNFFKFDESIYAYYLNYHLNFKKTSLSIGSRLEYNLNRFGNDGLNKKNDNLKLLPTISYNIPLNKNNSIYFYASKKIDRPSYYSYNPTIIEYTPTQAGSGNEALKPVDIYSFQMGYTLKRKYSLLANYSYQENTIISTPEFIDSKGYTLTHPVNSGYRNTAFLMLNIPVKYFKWWESTNKISFKYARFFSPLIIPRQNFESTYATISSYQTFNLPDDIEIDLDFSYATGYKSFYYNYADNFSSNITISAPVFKKKFQLYLYLSDIFNTDRSITEYQYNDIYSRNYSKINTRAIYLGLSYSFKIGKDVNESMKKSNIEGEKRRVGH
jgi:Outer membrane protein beta-barrel family/CarboxypepD_reg-like domain